MPYHLLPAPHTKQLQAETIIIQPKPLDAIFRQYELFVLPLREMVV